MSRTLIVLMITVVVALSYAAILRWGRHFMMRRICPSEIFLLESVEERNRVCDRGYIAFLKHWRTWMTIVIYCTTLVLASAALSEWARAATQGGQWRLAGARLAGVLPAIGLTILIPLIFVQYRKWMRVFLREYLNDHGIPICLNCGYDLRGLVSGACPECGTGFEHAETE